MLQSPPQLTMMEPPQLPKRAPTEQHHPQLLLTLMVLSLTPTPQLLLLMTMEIALQLSLTLMDQPPPLLKPLMEPQQSQSPTQMEKSLINTPKNQTLTFMELRQQ